MATNFVAGEIPPGDKAGIIQGITDIRNRLDFKIPLTEEQIRAMPKANSRLGNFMDQAGAVVVDHPEVLPSAFKGAAFTSKSVLIADLDEINRHVVELAALLKKTLQVGRSELYSASLKVYRTASDNAEEVSGIDATVAGMADHFKKPKRKKADPEEGASSTPATTAPAA